MSVTDATGAHNGWAGRTHHHREYPVERLATGREESVSVCLPARNEAATISANVAALVPLLEAGVIDQLVVVDDSTDGTAALAAAAGAEVHLQRELAPELGPVLGKGDAMWRALSVLEGEVVCFLDADSEDLGDHFARGLLGPLLLDPARGQDGELAFVKGFYRRPFRLGDVVLPDGGGRVTELTARPLLELLYPELAGVVQPLAGEIAVRRALLDRLRFTTGYGVDIALLIDAYRAVGVNGLAQVDLDVRQNSHQALHDLRPMARAVLEAIHVRLMREGRLCADTASGLGAAEFHGTGSHAVPAGGFSAPVVERPPRAPLLPRR